MGLLAEEGFVHHADHRWQWTHESYPADAVSLRSVSSDNFVVIDTTRGSSVVGEVDFTSGTSTLHEKAIYSVEGQLYQVQRLDFDGRKAYVEEVECDYYTDAITYTKVTVLEVFDTSAKEVLPAAGSIVDAEAAGGRTTASEPPESGARRDPGGARRSHGEVHVVSRVVGFKKIKFYTNENVGSGELDLPEQQMHTTAYWLTVPREIMAALPYAADDKRDGIVGLAFAMRNVAQLLLMCDRHDIGISIDGEAADGAVERVGGTESTTRRLAPEPQIFIYDSYPGGIGFSEPLHGLHGELLVRTRDLIGGCPCDAGCPSCVGPVGDAGELAKAVASRLLELMLA